VKIMYPVMFRVFVLVLLLAHHSANLPKPTVIYIPVIDDSLGCTQ
jgi:hypothetical protein